MEDTIKAVAAKAGINTDQAHLAVGAVLETLKSKLPAPIAGQLEGLLGGKTFDVGAVAQAGFGDVADKAKDIAGDVAEKAQEAFEGAKNMLGGLLGGKKD